MSECPIVMGRNAFRFRVREPPFPGSFFDSTFWIFEFLSRKFFFFLWLGDGIFEFRSRRTRFLLFSLPGIRMGRCFDRVLASAALA